MTEATPARRRRVVLIVEDQADILGFLTDALEGEDYAVRVARSGQDALDAALAEPPDVILLDSAA